MHKNEDLLKTPLCVRIKEHVLEEFSENREKVLQQYLKGLKDLLAVMEGLRDKGSSEEEIFCISYGKEGLILRSSVGLCSNAPSTCISQYEHSRWVALAAKEQSWFLQEAYSEEFSIPGPAKSAKEVEIRYWRARNLYTGVDLEQRIDVLTYIGSVVTVILSDQEINDGSRA